MNYGMPYKGSKSKIAQWVIEQLPPAETFVDIFAGGCAVTHAAMLSGKYERFICNDINGMTMIFKNAINGEYKDFSEVPSRDDFFLSDDAALKLLYSFGNDKSTYLWGGEYEKLKVPASRMISAPSIAERRKHYREFIKALKANIETLLEKNRVHALQGLEGLQRLEGLQGLEVTMADYQNIKIPDDAVVYADPPYLNTGEHYGGFDFGRFHKWLASVDFPVYVSEYDAPPGCVQIAEKETVRKMAAHTSGKQVERIFIQKRFAELKE